MKPAIARPLAFAVPWIVLAAALLASCKKNDAGPTSPGASAATEADAGDLVAGALGAGTSTGGMAAQVEEAAVVAGGQPLPPFPSLAKSTDVAVDTTVVREFVGLVRQYSYTFAYSWQFSTDRSELDFGYSMNGTYSTPLIAGRDTANAGYHITKIGDRDSVLAFTGTYRRLGIQTLKDRNGIRIYSLTDIAFTGMLVGKSSGVIAGGTANVTVQGFEESTGIQFTYVAVVTFLGNQQARMVVNGKAFMLNLSTGDSTPA